MINKNNKGFTLVELLAVIAVLGLILIIAVPKVMDVLNTQKKRTLELTTRSIIKAAEEKYLENTSYGINEEISCEGISNINSSDFESCKISFDDNGNASVIINGKGRYDDLACQGTKEGITCQKGHILKGLNCTYDGELVQGVEFTQGQYTYRYKEEYAFDWSTGVVSWISTKQDGWHVRLADLESTEPVNTQVCSYINGKPLVSTSYMFMKELYAKFTHTSEIDVSEWDTDNVTNMEGMFAFAIGVSEIKGLSNLETNNVKNMKNMFCISVLGTLDIDNIDFDEIRFLDLSGFNTDKVIDMSGMFLACGVNVLNLNKFNTTNVTNMSDMFAESFATTINLSSFNTSKVTDMSSMFEMSSATTINLIGFDTSNVADMSRMFSSSAATTIDLSSFDTSNVTDMNSMFSGSAATTGYAKTQADADRFNATSNKPETLTFIVKPN